jgi:hypothetical protein
MLSGGAFVATAGPASALAGGGQTCTSLVGSVDLSQAVPTLNGTLSGCNSLGHNPGSISVVVDITGAAAPGSIVWASGKATSLITLTAAVDFSGGPCPGGDIAVDATLTVGQGPYEGTRGTGIICADISGFPIVTLTNFGPVSL